MEEVAIERRGRDLEECAIARFVNANTKEWRVLCSDGNRKCGYREGGSDSETAEVAGHGLAAEGGDAEGQ